MAWRSDRALGQCRLSTRHGFSVRCRESMLCAKIFDGGSSFVDAGEITEMMLPSIDAGVSPPFFIGFIPCNTSHARLVVTAHGLVAMINRFRYVSKVFDSVVRRITVDVVNVAVRNPAMSNKPRYSMRENHIRLPFVREFYPHISPNIRASAFASRKPRIKHLVTWTQFFAVLPGNNACILVVCDASRQRRVNFALVHNAPLSWYVVGDAAGDDKSLFGCLLAALWILTIAIMPRKSVFLLIFVIITNYFYCFLF